jgi:rhodanese-related sulfurtransferase
MVLQDPTKSEIDVAELAQLLAAGDVNLVDVREPWEFRRGHVAGAQLIPVNSIPARLGELPTDKPLTIICEHGNRSLVATHFLRVKGFPETVSVAGGTSAWIRSGRPVVKE